MRFNDTIITPAMILAIGSAATLAVPAAAQTIAPAAQEATVPPPAKDAGLEDIVVTAQRVEASLQDTPISVTAFSGEALRQKGAVSLLDLSAFTPNLAINSRAGKASTRASFSIRGMGVGSEDSSASVGIYVDEVYFPAGYGNALGLLDVQRVEILRGPQGTLFGRNTIAGAVQYVTVKPDSRTISGFVEATGGNFDRYAVNGAINLPITETLAIRVAGLYDHQGGFVTNDLTGRKIGDTETVVGRVQLRWKPTDRLTVDLKGDFATVDANGRAVTVLGVNRFAQFVSLAQRAGETRPLTDSYAQADKYHVVGLNAPESFRSRQKSVAGTVAYELSDTLALKSITAWQRAENRLLFDGDLTPLSILAGDSGLITDTLFTQELQLSGKLFSDRVGFTLGGYYFDGTQETLRAGQFVGLGPFQVIASNSLKTEALAFFGQANFDVTDTLSLVAGARYSRERLDTLDLTTGLTYSTRYNDVSPTFGINFRPTSDLFFYAKASKGFRAGGLTVSSLVPGGSIPFGPETAWTYELGARMEFLNGRLRINPTLFYTDWKGIQFNYRQTFGTAIVSATQNAGDARLKGGEIETQFAVTDKLVLSGSLSILDSKYTRVPLIILRTYPQGFYTNPFSNPPVAGPVVNVVNLDVDQPLQQAPESKYTIGARYTEPLANGASIIASLDYGWTAKMRSVVTNGGAITLPSYGILNGRLQYQATDARWSIAVYGTNILDKYYLIGANAFGKSWSIGVDEGDLGRPREFGLTARFAF